MRKTTRMKMTRKRMSTIQILTVSLRRPRSFRDMMMSMKMLKRMSNREARLTHRTRKMRQILAVMFNITTF
jgi:hypothetical protein